MDESQPRNLLKNERLAVILLVILSATLRFAMLGRESLWIDEGYSLRDAGTWENISVVRPLYFIILHFWMRLGHGEAWLRLPAAIFGVISVVLIYYVAKRLFGRRVGMLAAIFMAINPIQIDHSQEIRMYSLTTLTVLATVLFFLKYRESGKMGDMTSCMLWGIISFLTYPMAATMFIAFGIFFILTFRTQQRTATLWLSVQTAMLLMLSPVLPRLLETLREFLGQWSWGMNNPNLISFVTLIRDFNLWHIPDHYPKFIIIGNIYGAAMIAIIGLGVALSWKRLRWEVVLAILWLLIPIIVTGTISYSFGNIWMTRYMIYVSPAYYMLLALGLLSIKPHAISQILVAGVIISIMLPLGNYYAKLHRPEWRPAVTYIEKNQKDGDAIGVFSYGNRYIFSYYYTGKSPYFALGPRVVSKDAITGWNDMRIARMISVIPKKSKRIWFALYYKEYVGEFQLEEYLKRNFTVLSSKEYNRVKVYLVSTKGRRDSDLMEKISRTNARQRVASAVQDSNR